MWLDVQALCTGGVITLGLITLLRWSVVGFDLLLQQALQLGGVWGRVIRYALREERWERGGYLAVPRERHDEARKALGEAAEQLHALLERGITLHDAHRTCQAPGCPRCRGAEILATIGRASAALPATPTALDWEHEEPADTAVA